MIKDRLAELKAVQVQDREEEFAVTFTVSNDSLSVFYRQVDELNIAIQFLNTSVDEVEKLHSQILSAPRADDKTKMRLEDLMFEIKRTASKVRNRLKAMDAEVQKLEDRGCAEYRIKKTQQSTLEHGLVQVMTDYNNMQNDYREKCKKRIQRQLEITGRTTTDDEVEEMLEQGNPAVFTQGIEMDTQQARQTLADIEARHEDIMKLEKSIREVHDLFVDMATLIEKQGDKIDSIESHVTNTRSFVEKAVEQTSKALVYQGKARTKKLICYGVIAVAVLVLILSTAIPLLTGNSSGSSSSSTSTAHASGKKDQ